MNISDKQKTTFLIVGGGIAGVTCAETLAMCCPKESILLLTATNVVKTVTNLTPVSRYLYKFDVKECDSKDHLKSSVRVLVDNLSQIDVSKQCAYTKTKICIEYNYLCLCTGAVPQLIATNNERVIGIRDTDSVLQLEKRLKDAKSVIVVGNGGIASELVYELKNVEVHWVIKDKHISATFVDPGAAYFFQQKSTTSEGSNIIKRWRYSEIPNIQNSNEVGAALGPDWQRNFQLTGNSSEAAKNTPIIHFKANISEISNENPMYVVLDNGERLSCDFIVSATGVQPHLNFLCDEKIELATDGGILVNDMMETNVKNIYAAGDVCTANWAPAEHWFQMRLWTQARQMGAMAGRSMAAAFENEKIYQDFAFELFGHVTQLFGYAVVLLGRYNGQGLNNDYEILLRSTPGKEYIKFVLQRGRLRGALLIGNTELAETCENLILNGIDLTPFGDDILNPDIDIEDYFD